MRFAAIILLAFSLTVQADDKDEVKKLEGNWELVGIVAGGKEQPKEKAPNLTIKAGVMIGFGPEMKLATDATKKPKWLNMTFKRDGAESTINAIYELNGDELNIVMPLAPAKGSGAVFENKRPEGFDTKDKPEMLIKLKRAK
ncbi:MAG TPA: TIGR03067 domain-containing protein [Gemmataceae bacterium]|nr:TIGR03067 domain-containing protein [Gemmataceae bacterium]